MSCDTASTSVARIYSTFERSTSPSTRATRTPPSRVERHLRERGHPVGARATEPTAQPDDGALGSRLHVDRVHQRPRERQPAPRSPGLRHVRHWPESRTTNSTSSPCWSASNDELLVGEPVRVLDRVRRGLVHRDRDLMALDSRGAGARQPILDGSTHAGEVPRRRGDPEPQRGVGSADAEAEQRDIVRRRVVGQEVGEEGVGDVLRPGRSRCRARRARRASPASSDSPRRSISPSVYSTSIEPGGRSCSASW